MMTSTNQMMAPTPHIATTVILKISSSMKENRSSDAIIMTAINGVHFLDMSHYPSNLGHPSVHANQPEVHVAKVVAIHGMKAMFAAKQAIRAAA